MRWWWRGRWTGIGEVGGEEERCRGICGEEERCRRICGEDWLVAGMMGEGIREEEVMVGGFWIRDVGVALGGLRVG